MEEIPDQDKETKPREKKKSNEMWDLQESRMQAVYNSLFPIDPRPSWALKQKSIFCFKMFEQKR